MTVDGQRIVVLNSGSSSLKFAAYRPGRDGERLLSGEVEGIGGKARLQMGGTAKDVTAADPVAAMHVIADLPDGPMAGDVVAFGHRIVHGGPDLDRPVLVDEPALARIDAVSPLAPLHNPPALAVLRGLRDRFPGIPHVACFDTAFHRGHPPVADRFAIPEALYQEGVRRYGFHGLSYQYIAGVLPPEIAGGRVAVAHLGSGASMCGLVNRRSVDSSMGFTALDGLPMGTRSGSLDAGVILWLQQHKGWPVDRVEAFLYHDCGLKGMSGLSNDIRVLLASETPSARMAVDYFVYHVARTAGALASSMGGIDGLVFTAGIGEHSDIIRARVLDRLGWMGFRVDAAANAKAPGRITGADSRLPAYVIPTDEERVIGNATCALVGV
ncbi:MAG TPA: acetate/propionate family kinase [Rhodopila sp.]|uniref:acetate/propionate family kinase n=1 Tax=Rhodopila sp. TaxID=2480087 RepID=UPI002C8D12A9|nr:acetate/propionate family kinase [Rhodopila sp.]HVY15437.1 acetate/propionate family kinase [Rhodopila sp.]